MTAVDIPHLVAQELLALTQLDQPRPNQIVLNDTGPGPFVNSVFRIGPVAAGVLAAQGVAIDQIWRMRGGQPLTVTTSRLAGALATMSVQLQLQHGYAIPLPDPAYPTVDIYRARDGRHIMIHGGYPKLRDGLLTLLRCSNDKQALTNAVAQWDSFDLEDAIAERGLCGVVARSREEWLTHAQGEALAQTPIIELTKIGDAPPTPIGRAGFPSDRPLSGVRALDLTHVLAGPTCGKTLAVHGADVMHITTPTTSTIPSFDYDTGHGKLSALLTLPTPGAVATQAQLAAAERLRELVRQSDVFTQSYRPGAIAAMGFSPMELARLKPGIIAVDVSCYGFVGPWAMRPGWEQLAQVATGMAQAQGAPDAPALQTTYPNDYLTGFLAAQGVLAALVKRATEGGSWHVRVALCRTAMWLQDFGQSHPASPPPALTPEQKAPYMRSEVGALGELSFLGPCLSLAPEADPYWARTTAPLGANPPVWPTA